MLNTNISREPHVLLVFAQLLLECSLLTDFVLTVLKSEFQQARNCQYENCKQFFRDHEWTSDTFRRLEAAELKMLVN